MATVSVIVPNYNHAKYLDQRIRSIIDQSWQDLELIILDDRSTDSSKEIIEQYRSHPKVSHIVYNEQNSGSPFKQWQKGMELACGEYIWIAESDDFADANFLQRAIDSVRSNGVEACFSNSYLYEDGVRGLMFDIGDGKDYVIDGSEMLKNWIVDRTGIRIGNTSSAIISRDLEQKVINASQFSEYRYAGDKAFWLYALANAKVAVIAEPLNYFRVHGQSTSKVVLNSAKKVAANVKENLQINTIAQKLLLLSDAEISLLQRERTRRINQVLNRTSNPVTRFFKKYYYNYKFADL